MTLSEYLNRQAAEPFAWGKTDCMTLIADWVAERRGVDPARPLRGRYRSHRGALRAIRLGGGVESLTKRLAAEAGLKLTDRPSPGDIGLVMTSVGVVGGIRTSTGWACRGQQGLLIAPFALITAWAV